MRKKDKKPTDNMEKKNYSAPRIDETILESPVIMEVTTLSQGEKGKGTGVAESNKREDHSNTKDADWGNLW